MAKSKIRDLNPAGQQGLLRGFSRFDEYENMLANAVRIVRKDGSRMDYNEEVFVKRALIEDGKVGFDKVGEKWYYVYGQMRNELGNPVSLVFHTANGRTLTRTACYDKDADGAYIIRAYPFGMSLASMIKASTDFMDECDVAITQNLEACKTPYIVVCRDDNLRLSFEQAIQRKQQGQAVLLVSEELGKGLEAVNISTSYLVDKFQIARELEREKLLNRLGIMTANTEKRERVYRSEVLSTVGLASDYIYLLIDTFNKQADSYDIPFEMQYNGSMEEIYVDGKGRDLDYGEKQESEENQNA